MVEKLDFFLLKDGNKFGKDYRDYPNLQVSEF